MSDSQPGVGDICWILESLVVSSGSGGVFAGQENILDLRGKCKPEDKFGKRVMTLCDVGACSAPV